MRRPGPRSDKRSGYKMSLLLCRQENVRHPYYMEVLGVHLYSSQELCYVICNYPLLVMEDFINQRLLEFIRTELGLEFLAAKLERFLRGGGSQDDALTMILGECDYYSAAEVAKFAQTVGGFRARHKADYGKCRADELFSIRQYAKAAAIYRKLLEYPKDSFVDDGFVARVLNNLGSCYARMFRLDMAMEAYGKAYLRDRKKDVLEQMVVLTMLDPKLSLADHVKALVDEELLARCEGKVEAARHLAARSVKVQQLEELFKKDSIRRRAGEAKLLGEWKQEYRRAQ